MSTNKMNSRGRQTRARIAATALALLRDKGSTGLTMRQVAAHSGLSLSNVQHHFKSREQLLIGITEHHLTLCSEALTRSLAKEPEITLGSILRVSLCDEDVLETAPAFRELFALARTEPGVRERLNAHYAHGLEQLVELLATISTQPGEQLVEVATVLMTSVEGAYLLAEATPVSGERLAARLEQVALQMLSNS